jgi:hypothetical protein
VRALLLAAASAGGMVMGRASRALVRGPVSGMGGSAGLLALRDGVEGWT